MSEDLIILSRVFDLLAWLLPKGALPARLSAYGHPALDGGHARGDPVE
jgi:hypothetical protein